MSKKYSTTTSWMHVDPDITLYTAQETGTYMVNININDLSLTYDDTNPLFWYNMAYFTLN